MKLSDYIIEFLAAKGVRHIYYLIGGTITHLVDSTIDNENLSCITMHHEQAAAFAAEGTARCNGNLGVAMATSGPGATNLVTGIGSCFFDSVPCLFITGQVNTYESRLDPKIRQVGFQETDVINIVRPIVKGARLVSRAEDIRYDLEWALHLAQSGRPGPVLLDIPMNIQRAEINLSLLQPYIDQKDTPKPIPNAQLTQIIADLKKAKRPVILAGGGVRTAHACEELFELVSKINIPVVASLMGLDAFPHTNPAYVGMIGAYGKRSANLAVANADFLLVLGSRLDTRQTGTKPQTFARAATIVHVDIDENELNRSIKPKYALYAHLKSFLKQFNAYLEGLNIKTTAPWLAHIKNCKQKLDIFPIAHAKEEIDPCEFIYLLSQQVASDAIISVDVGQHQMWAAQFFVLQPKQRMLISGGMGSMGFALPAAIGAAFTEPNRQIIVIVGDGGFQINLQDLQTIVRNNLKIKIVILNNKSLAMPKQFQEIYFQGRTEGTLTGYDTPDFIKIAAAYGLPSIKLQFKDEFNKKIKHFLNESAPNLMEVDLSSNTQVEPKLLVHDPIEDQYPKLSREELKELMFIDLVEPHNEKI